MIFSAEANLIVGSMGWVDKGTIWTFDPTTRIENSIGVDGSTYLSLRGGDNGLVRVVHHGCPKQTISIRALSRPNLELARVETGPGKPIFAGDVSLWQYVEPTAIINSEHGQRIISINALWQEVVDLDLSWYNGDAYDLGYQGLTDCITLKDSRVVVSVQRSSELIVIDSERNSQIGKVSLAGRHGNPILKMRSSQDFIASDYDTLCRVDAQSLKILTSARLQDGDGQNTQQFIGEYSLGYQSCVVARPFSGDIVRLEPETFAITGRAILESRQPLGVCMISDEQVVTRDWKTGKVAVSDFRPVSKHWWRF